RSTPHLPAENGRVPPYTIRHRARFPDVSTHFDESPTQAAAALEEGNAALQELCARLSADEMVRPATIGGGQWSAKDLLAHVAFWEELAAQTLADWRARNDTRRAAG